MGMRLSGIEGVVVHTSEEVSNALDKAMEMKDVGVVLMTELAVKQCREKVLAETGVELEMEIRVTE